MSKKRKDTRDMVLVIDLEATCWEGNAPEGMVSEIIEIGISAVDYVTKEIRLRDTIIVKPERSTISPFCTKLTTITQEFVDEHGIPFAEACKILEDKFKSKERVWMSWGEYDKNQIQKDCDLNKVGNPFGRIHINAKPLFSFAYGIDKDLGVGGALEQLGLEFEGTAHRGEDDAHNIARIIQKVFIPLIGLDKYGKKIKMEHRILEEHLNEKYDKDQLMANAARLINKEHPENPDKSMR